MMHRIMQIHIIYIIRWSQHILTIVSRVLFCRSCSESCGDGHYFSVYQRVCPWPLYLASNNFFILLSYHPLSTPSFNTLFHHPLHNHYASLSPFRFWVLRFCACHCRHHHTVVVIIVHILLRLSSSSTLHIAHCTFSTTSTTHFTQQHNDVPYFYLIDYNPQQMVSFKRVH